MNSRQIRWRAVAGSFVLAEVALIGAAFAWVAIYSHALNPGQPFAVYQAHAQVAGPWVSILMGMPVFFALGRWVLVNKPSAWTLYGLYLASIKAPSGDYRIRDAFGAIERPDLQPGSGSWDLTGAVQYQHRLGGSEWSIFLGGWGGLNGTNDLNYSFGDQISLTAGITRATPGRLRLSMQAGFLAIAKDRFLRAPVTATGLRSWTVTPGGRLRLGPGLSAYLFAKVPVVTRVHEAQLRPKVDILAGFSRTF